VVNLYRIRLYDVDLRNWTRTRIVLLEECTLLGTDSGAILLQKLAKLVTVEVGGVETIGTGHVVRNNTGRLPIRQNSGVVHNGRTPSRKMLVGAHIPLAG